VGMRCGVVTDTSPPDAPGLAILVETRKPFPCVLRRVCWALHTFRHDNLLAPAPLFSSARRPRRAAGGGGPPRLSEVAGINLTRPGRLEAGSGPSRDGPRSKRARRVEETGTRAAINFLHFVGAGADVDAIKSVAAQFKSKADAEEKWRPSAQRGKGHVRFHEGPLRWGSWRPKRRWGLLRARRHSSRRATQVLCQVHRPSTVVKAEKENPAL